MGEPAEYLGVQGARVILAASGNIVLLVDRFQQHHNGPLRELGQLLPLASSTR